MQHAQPFQVDFVDQSKGILHSAITNRPLKLHGGVVLAAHDDVEGRNKFIITVDAEPAQGPLSVTLEHVSHPHLSSLNLDIQGVNNVGDYVGGLLGQGDHTEATEPSSECSHKNDLRHRNAAPKFVEAELDEDSE